MLRFKTLSGDVNWRDYGGKWISPKQSNGEFDYWLVLEVINMHEATGDEDQAKYNVCVSSVSPDQAGPDKLQSAFECYGIEDQEHKDNPIIQVECLHDYGLSVPLWNEAGPNVSKLMREARKHAQTIPMLYGFYMDRPVNRIGTTGWEAQTGDLTSALHRNTDDPEIKLMRKISGITDTEQETRQ